MASPAPRVEGEHVIVVRLALKAAFALVVVALLLALLPLPPGSRQSERDTRPTVIATGVATIDALSQFGRSLIDTGEDLLTR